jgi:hypothetical protein
MDLRNLNQALNFICVVMTYMTSFPFVATSANADASKPSSPQRQTARPAISQRLPSVAPQIAATINPRGGRSARRVRRGHQGGTHHCCDRAVRLTATHSERTIIDDRNGEVVSVTDSIGVLVVVQVSA